MRKSFTIVAVLALATNVLAADRYWIGTGNPKNFNDSNNWSTTSGGSGGASVPGSSDKAIFDGSATGNCNIDASITIQQLDVQSGYTGSITQQTGYTFTVSQSSTFAGGTFTGGDSKIVLSGACTNSGCSFTSTSDRLVFNGDYTLSGTGTFTHNSGTVAFTAASSPTSRTISGNQTFYDLEFYSYSGHHTYNITSTDTLTVDNELDLRGQTTYRVIINDGKIIAKGDISSTHGSGNNVAGDAEIIIQGTVNQTITGSSPYNGPFPKVTVRKESNDTLFVSGSVCFDNDFTIDSGFVEAGTSTMGFCRNVTIDGEFTAYNIYFANKNSQSATITFPSSDTITVENDMTVAGNRIVNFNSGVVVIEGDIDAKCTNASNVAQTGSTWFVLSSSAPQTWKGSSISEGILSRVKIDKGTDTLFLEDEPSVAGYYTHISGVVISDTAKIGLVYGCKINYSTTLANVVMKPYGSTSKPKVWADSTLTITDSLTIEANGIRTLVIQDGTLDLKGDLVINNTVFTTNGYHDAIMKFSGTDDQTVYGTTSGGWPLPYVTIDKDTGVVVVKDFLATMRGFTMTKGIFWCDTTAGDIGYVKLYDGDSFTGASDSSYVDGTVVKVGNDAFWFAVGSGGNYQRVRMSAPGSTTDEFRCQYVGSGQTYGNEKDSSLAALSQCEYWFIDRTVGSSNVDLRFPLDSAACHLTDSINYVKVAHWNGSSWDDLGADATTGDATNGTVEVNSVSSFSPFVLAVSTLGLPHYADLTKKLDGGYYLANAVVYFRYNEEYNDADGNLTYNIYDRYNQVVASSATHPHSITYGYNYIGINGTCSSGIGLGSGHYVLEVINEKNEKWYLRFQNIRDMSCFEHSGPK